MLRHLRNATERLYERLLEAELSETPSHVAVIQDGNRRYASQRGGDPTDGHRAGAETTEALLNWCDELGIEEVTLYAFSTENFDRPPDERETLFDLIAEKLREFADADRVHEGEVRIRAIGETEQLPERVREAIAYAEARTNEYDSLSLNVALAYGGRAELLGAAREIATAVEDGELDPADVDDSTVGSALYEGPTRDVDLIVRTGGDERTSNFLPWQANGNEAAVYFSAPYWPEFRKVDFLRGIRTYEHRERSWRQSRALRARTLVRALDPTTDSDARQTFEQFRSALPDGGSDLEEPATDGSEADPAD
jgi:tritrans,polycis-undecaprenyl-diphosphate synthase [geranylgeranyl-diphosphate specific]